VLNPVVKGLPELSVGLDALLSSDVVSRDAWMCESASNITSTAARSSRPRVRSRATGS
jgi:hypothetical protein